VKPLREAVAECWSSLWYFNVNIGSLSDNTELMQEFLFVTVGISYKITIKLYTTRISHFSGYIAPSAIILV